MSDSLFIEDLAGGEPDPLDRLFNLCVQIENIITSYDDRFDAFSEMVQNSLDALRQEFGERDEFETDRPHLRVEIDLPSGRLSVADNGCGVSPEHRFKVIRPNESLKRRLRHKGARGEKGAALVFLQFDHLSFRFESRIGDESWAYQLADGSGWYRQTWDLVAAADDYEAIEAELPADPHLWEDASSAWLDDHERGSEASVTFGDDRLQRLFGDRKFGLERLEHILTTRTALGYVASGGVPARAEKFLEEMRVEIVIQTGEEGGVRSRDLEIGFFYPHDMALKDGHRKHSLLTNPSKDSELLYDFFDVDYVSKYLPDFYAKAEFSSILLKYHISGYVSYAFQNTWYEKVASKLLGLPDETTKGGIADEELRYELLQVNGGFQVAVRNYPNGRRHAFLHRSGAEHKSRTYVILNFHGDYKPDYGRKNLADEVRGFVNEFCKALISFAIKPEHGSFLAIGVGTAPHGVQDVEEAREKLVEEETAFRAQGEWLRSKDGFVRPPNTEAEVTAEFASHVERGSLVGYTIYGAPMKGQLDGTFDYHLDVSAEFTYEATDRPLGVNFREGAPLHSESQWLEYKISSDLLINDFNKAVGEGGKKYFTTINLLVCESVDDATDNYSVIEITEETSASRRYFGVTHVMTSSQNHEHSIQVIELKTLRAVLSHQLADSGGVEEEDGPVGGAEAS